MQLVLRNPAEKVTNVGHMSFLVRIVEVNVLKFANIILVEYEPWHCHVFI